MAYITYGGFSGIDTVGLIAMGMLEVIFRPVKEMYPLGILGELLVMLVDPRESEGIFIS